MGRMTEDAIKALFNYGKKVYQKNISLDDAAEKVHDESPEVAFSSAKHYIRCMERCEMEIFLLGIQTQTFCFIMQNILSKKMDRKQEN